MKLPLIKRFWIFLPVALLLSANTCAEKIDYPGSDMDILERQLEMGRHEQLATRKALPGNSLARFTTDGCSGGLSIGWEYVARKIPRFQSMHGTHPAWEPCCIEHDQAYHAGGGREVTAVRSFDARKQADLALRACVLETGVRRTPGLSIEYDVSSREVETLYTVIADLMYKAVRIGGMPCTGLPWRWGYGWPACD